MVLEVDHDVEREPLLHVERSPLERSLRQAAPKTPTAKGIESVAPPSAWTRARRRRRRRRLSSERDIDPLFTVERGECDRRGGLQQHVAGILDTRIDRIAVLRRGRRRIEPI